MTMKEKVPESSLITFCKDGNVTQVSTDCQFHDAATPPVPVPWGGSVIGGRNIDFSFPDMLAISGS